MRKSVWALLTVVTLGLLIVPSVSNAEASSHKYAVELQLGGGSTAMTDVNDYLPSAAFSGITPASKLDVGMAFGVGLLYRCDLDAMPNWLPGNPYFGYQFGYNRFVSLADSKYRISDGGLPESWAEQTISGTEISAQAAWYWPIYKRLEVSLSMGPALYLANMDRQLNIVNSSGSIGKEGSFSNANGKALGFVGGAGLEIPFADDLSVAVVLGGRYAKISKLTYDSGLKDANGNTIYNSVWLDEPSQRALPVDYSGVFLKFTLRGYFGPSGDWRSLHD